MLTSPQLMVDMSSRRDTRRRRWTERVVRADRVKLMFTSEEAAEVHVDLGLVVRTGGGTAAAVTAAMTAEGADTTTTGTTDDGLALNLGTLPLVRVVEYVASDSLLVRIP
jgi:hypothetical protein